MRKFYERWLYRWVSPVTGLILLLIIVLLLKS